jgi:hypothetical protein
MCFSPRSPLSPSAAITSPSALRLRLMFCVSRRRAGSAPAPLALRRSLPARSTRFRLASQRSPVRAFVPATRSVNTLCERDERSFISVAATLRRPCARASSARTCAGERRGRTAASVTRVPRASCLISCLRSSPVPSRSCTVSLYCRWCQRRTGAHVGKGTHDLEELAFHGVLPALGAQLLCGPEDLLDGAGYHAHARLGLDEA